MLPRPVIGSVQADEKKAFAVDLPTANRTFVRFASLCFPLLGLLFFWKRKLFHHEVIKKTVKIREYFGLSK